MTFPNTTTVAVSGLGVTSELAQTISPRSNILEMTQKAEDAVLRPIDFGAFPHDLRAALAARIARLSNDDLLADHYITASQNYADLAHPNTTGEAQGLGPVLAFVDLVANAPRDVSAGSVTTLQSAGIKDADVVRLCELVAFVAYQLRVVSGLRMMQGKAA